MDTEDTSELAKGLLMDFQKSTFLHILNKVVFLVQQALGQLSAASTSQFTALTTLVDALYGRFNHSYDLTDLDDQFLVCKMLANIAWSKIAKNRT